MHDLRHGSGAEVGIGDPRTLVRLSSDASNRSDLPIANHPMCLTVVDIDPTERTLEPARAFSSNFHKSGAFQVD